MGELSRTEDLLKTGTEETVKPLSRVEAILRGEKIKPLSRIEELLLEYSPGGGGGSEGGHISGFEASINYRYFIDFANRVNLVKDELYSTEANNIRPFTP